MKPQLILIGAPGSGKGTQSKRLVNGMGYDHISTGDLLRKEISEGSDLGNRVKKVMEEGGLVDDETVLEILKSNCDVSSKVFIFDGYPRNLEQAKELTNQILSNSRYLVLYFKIDQESLVSRIVNRRLASKSGEIYNLISRPPKIDGICDVSGEKLIHRDDDKEEVVRKRMKVFDDNAVPMLDFYKEKGVLVEINAEKDADVIYQEIEELVRTSS